MIRIIVPQQSTLAAGGQATLHHSKKESKEMLKGLMIRQATKAGVIFWKRGVSGFIFPNINDPPRQSAGRRGLIPDNISRRKRNLFIRG